MVEAMDNPTPVGSGAGVYEGSTGLTLFNGWDFEPTKKNLDALGVAAVLMLQSPLFEYGRKYCPEQKIFQLLDG